MTNILVCDDDKEIVDAIEIYLLQEGYNVLKAYDGDMAIKILKEHDVKLVIMDIMMIIMVNITIMIEMIGMIKRNIMITMIKNISLYKNQNIKNQLQLMI